MSTHGLSHLNLKPEHLRRGIFVTGTDTGIGKTTVTCHLLRYYQQQGCSTLATKPIASGAYTTPEGQLIHEDALALKQHASLQLPYSAVNPIVFKEPIAPHLLAQRSGQMISYELLDRHYQAALQHAADVFFIEGVGGWQLPLNTHQTFADWVQKVSLPVLIVVGMRLGCLNHTLLTYKAIVSAGLHVVGWVANKIDPDMSAVDENIETLKHMLSAPCLEVLEFIQPHP